MPSIPWAVAGEVSWCYPLPALPSRSPDPSHPTAAARTPSRARPCQNTSPVPEPRRWVLRPISMVPDGDRGHPGMGAGSFQGHGGARWGAVGSTREHRCLCHGRAVGMDHGCPGVCMGLVTPRELGQGQPGAIWSSSRLPLPPQSATPTLSEPLHIHSQSPWLRVEPCPQLHGVSSITWGGDPGLGRPLVGGHEPCTPGSELGPQLQPGWLHPILPPILTGTASSHWVCFHLNGDILCDIFYLRWGWGWQGLAGTTEGYVRGRRRSPDCPKWDSPPAVLLSWAGIPSHPGAFPFTPSASPPSSSPV